MMDKEIINIKTELIHSIKKIIKIIKQEYGDLTDIPKNIKLENHIHIEQTNTISLFVWNKHFYFPIDAFKVLWALKKIPGFGSNPNHKAYNENNLIDNNNNTYITYLKHVFIAGFCPKEYFDEILVHETLHFCGSGGVSALREGINELKTRQLAQKHGLLTSGCGYPKEVKIALELEQLFGKNLVDRIAFAKSNLEIKEILDSVSEGASEFYFTIQELMEKEFYNKYMKYKFPEIIGPIQKVKKYNTVDYTNVYNQLSNINIIKIKSFKSSLLLKLFSINFFKNNQL